MNSAVSEQNLTWFRGFIQGKTRITIAWVFAILLGLSSQQYPIWPGVLLCFAGATLRFWASGYLRKDTKPAVGGPYAFIRNPLYVGTYCMALGTAWAIQNWILLIVSTIVFAGIYHFIILDEETKLKRIFNHSYLEYCESVPRFFPRIWPPLAPAKKDTLIRINPEQSCLKFSWTLAMKNRAYEAYLSFVGLIAFVSAMAFVWERLR